MAFKCSPVFADGNSYVIVKTKSELLELVSIWADVAKELTDEPATLEYVEMSDKEVDALPEI